MLNITDWWLNIEKIVDIAFIRGKIYDRENEREISMKLWFRKLFVVFIAVLTLGMYVPPFVIDTNANDNKDAVASKSDLEDNETQNQEVGEQPERSKSDDELSVEDTYIEQLKNKAREQVLTKMGPRIVEQVEDEFTESILPIMQEVLESVLLANGERNVGYFAITEQPAKGLGERIFNVYDVRSQKDIIRFHARRDKRPMEGYWFNFHYHLSTDNFEKHYQIGDIYWDKNMPPRWMA